jgi:hypothetical protein
MERAAGAPAAGVAPAPPMLLPVLLPLVLVLVLVLLLLVLVLALDVLMATVTVLERLEAMIP